MDTPDAGLPVLDVTDLAVAIDGRTVVSGVDLRIAPGECVALVGPSGSGKSVTARALLGLSTPGARVTAGRLELDGADLRTASERRWRRIRGHRVGYVGQEALGALDPLRPVGREVADALRLHTGLTARERLDRVAATLDRVGLDPALARDGRRADTLSGGMRQRALIAAAIVGGPTLVIADEPTTALDAGIAVTVMETLQRVRDAGAGLLLITHDMGLVAGWADRVAVMTDGRIVESGRTASVLRTPRHPVTRALVAAAERARVAVRSGSGFADPVGGTAGSAMAAPPAATADPAVPADPAAGAGPAVGAGPAGHAVPPASSAAREPVLVGEDLGARYDGRSVLEHVDLALARGRTLGVVGASGSGKTTLARVLLGLTDPATGRVRLDGAAWAPLPEAARRARRHRIAAVVQDPGSTFDERWSVERVLVDALTAGRARRAAGAVADAVDAALRRVDLDPVLRPRGPRTLSGGQRQRLAIARALATGPDLLLLDEPVTALDATVQDAVLALLERLQRETGTTMLFVSHDLAAVRRMSDDVLVLDAGRVVEAGPADRVFGRPAHPVTARLLAAAERLAAG
ncbi:ABC transporter ATP-binding protein [Curtobacterium sp. MCBD17_019]|uniref:ATP-binding cassette domain-containing protein n=1 Tax=Curtobacterium sp. MCBD17_019 TaxID=2175669 RepID=UPI0021AC1882|nr:ABC transporter ATP-binding protein [Curtobacterium sp. MCBD17_019]